MSLSPGDVAKGRSHWHREKSCAAPSLPQALMTLTSPEQPGCLTLARGCSSTAPAQVGDPAPLVWPPWDIRGALGM